jgi:hypothetical protein
VDAVMATIKPEPVQNFLCKAICVFKSMRAFLNAHNNAEKDQAKIVTIENVSFSLKRRGATI